MAEKEQIREKARQVEQARFEVQITHTSILQARQEDHAAQRKAMLIANSMVNEQLAKEKRDRDLKASQDLQLYADIELNYTLSHDFMTENPATEQSMLAPHRVKPYHFKGFNEQKQQAILDERAGQIRAQEAAKLTAKDQEK